MSSWDGTKLGFKVNAADELVARQLLTVMGINMAESYMVEEIGRLSDLSGFTADGLVEGDLLGAMKHLERHFLDYQKQFGDVFDYYEEYGDDEDEDEKCRLDVFPDDIFQIAVSVLSHPSMYIAHEEGNDTSDTSYRCEIIYTPWKKTELDCYYSYGKGINTETDSPKAEGTVRKEEKLKTKKPDTAIVQLFVGKAETGKFFELAERLKKISS